MQLTITWVSKKSCSTRIKEDGWSLRRDRQPLQVLLHYYLPSSFLKSYTRKLKFFITCRPPSGRTRLKGWGMLHRWLYFLTMMGPQHNKQTSNLLILRLKTAFGTEPTVFLPWAGHCFWADSCRITICYKVDDLNIKDEGIARQKLTSRHSIKRIDCITSFVSMCNPCFWPVIF